MLPIPDRFYRPELDVLRFGAFALVFGNHALPSKAGMIAAGLPYAIWGPIIGLKEGGAYGVDLFFLLSAYLITEILLREYRATAAINVSSFWIRRILRIWPLYFGFLALAFWVIPYLYPQNFPAFHALAYGTFWGNFAVIMAPDGVNTVAGILWSVSIEEQFYLLWPIVLVFCMRRLRAVCIGLILVSTIVRVYLVVTGVDSVWSLWGNTFTRLEPIAVGALIALELNGTVPKLRTDVRIMAIVSGLIIIVVCGMAVPKEGPAAMIAYPLATLAAASMLLGTLGAPWGMPNFLVYLGRISFGLYVFHALALLIARTHLHIAHSFLEWAVQFLGALVITVLLASISYHWYEKPFLRLKKHFSPGAKPERVVTASC